MKFNKVQSSIAIAGLALALGVPAGLTAWGAQQNRAQHPEIDRSLRDLKEAETDLNNAAHDYGGYRVKAMENIRQAEDNLQKALQYAAQHPNEK